MDEVLEILGRDGAAMLLKNMLIDIALYEDVYDPLAILLLQKIGEKHYGAKITAPELEPLEVTSNSLIISDLLDLLSELVPDNIVRQYRALIDLAKAYWNKDTKIRGEITFSEESIHIRAEIDDGIAKETIDEELTDPVILSRADEIYDQFCDNDIIRCK